MNTYEKPGEGWVGYRPGTSQNGPGASLMLSHLTTHLGSCTTCPACWRRVHRDAHHSPMTASASISTSISGEIRLLTCTMLVAGRIAPKNSPCARPTFSHSAMLVT